MWYIQSCTLTCMAELWISSSFQISMNASWVLISVWMQNATTLLAATPVDLASQVLFLEIWPLVVSCVCTYPLTAKQVFKLHAQLQRIRMSYLNNKTIITVLVLWNVKVQLIVLCFDGGYHLTHSTLRPPPLFLPIRFSYKYGGGLIIYTPPFLTVERARETAMVELSVTVLCILRWSS